MYKFVTSKKLIAQIYQIELALLGKEVANANMFKRIEMYNIQ